MTTARFQWRLFGVIIALFALVPAARAHDPGLSSADVEVGNRQVRVVLTYNSRDVASTSADSLAVVARRAVQLSADGEVLAPQSVSAARDANANDEFTLIFDLSASARELTFRSMLLPELPFGHRQAFVLRDAAGQELARRLLSAKEDSATAALSPVEGTVGSSSFLDFLVLGIRHILTGYDHLLFLFALLVMCRNARAAAVLITCFTAAHSLTLGLATFGVVNLPSRFVEGAIAASILYVGLENLVYRERVMRTRWILTFCFGLIHGLGFASVLREMGIASHGASAVAPLVGFNLGVEVGQLAVAAVVLPIVWSLRRRPGFIRVGIPACSALVALAGASWLVARTVF